ncbi:MAG: hypothetical protein IJK52_04395, partial [Oscillospiraceae bacterium]|nr:hypothetical protein [Oscillospiraceae bacterium]
MKRKFTSVLCALIMLFSASGLVPATASDNESAPESGEAERAYDPGANPNEDADTGLFVITGTDESLGVSGAEESSDIPEGTGRDAETLNAAPKVSETGSVPADDETLGSSVIAPDAKPAITVSGTSVSLKAGETSSVTVTVSGYPAGSYLQSSNNNFNAFSCAWGDWRGTSVPLRITGKDGGSGSIALRLKDTSNQELASVTVSVTVLKSVPTLTVSPDTVSVNVGESQQAALTVKNYSGGGFVSAQVSDSSICDVKFGAWSGWSVPVTITGKAAGNAKITLKLYNSVRTQLASVTFSATVSGKASLSVSPGSPSLYAGESAMLTVSVSGSVNDGDYLQYSVSNPTAFSAAWTGQWSGNSMKLNLTGKNAGSGALTVRLKNRAGVALDEKVLPVEVSVRNSPKVSVSPSSVNLAAGASVDVRCTGQNISESFCLRYVNNNPALLQCVWQSRWSGNSIPLTITGKAAGTGSVTVELIIGSAVRASATITVNVTGGGNGGGGDNGGGGQTGQSPSYAFDNYSKPGISLAICQYMFGNTQRAKTVYDWDIGNGGVCFGMSATSALLLSPNQPNADAFGNALIAKLKKSDYSGGLQMSLSDFIEAMHISQVASAMKESSGVSAMVNAVRDGGTSQPVIICMRGPGGGHAILAYGLTSNGSLRVYDSNWPGQERTLTVNGSQWSYNMWQGLTWSSSNARISYIPYSVYSAIWGNRGSLNGARLQDGGVLNGEEELRYLLVTDADDFTLLNFDENVMARYENGVLYDKADDVEEVFLDSVLLKSEAPAGLHML